MILAETVRSFETFGPSHVAVIALTVIVGAALPVWARMAKSQKTARGICWAVAMGLLVNEFVYYGQGLATRTMIDFARNCLPIHVCGAAIYLTAWALLKRGQRVYEIAYFWGLGGTVQALLTPNIVDDFPAYWFVQYFITHGGIVAGVLFATFGLKMRPRRGAVLRAFVITNLYTGFVAGVDWLLGANYMFLCSPPVGKSPFFFLPWPWYILFLEAVGLGFLLLLYLPFVLSDRLRRRSSAR